MFAASIYLDDTETITYLQLPVLSNIAPPELRRKGAHMKEYNKLMSTPGLSIYH